MNEDDLISLSLELQRAFDSKDLENVLSFYHPDIVIISPSYIRPVVGIEALREAVARQFASPQRTSVSLKKIKSYRVSESVELVVCEATGHQSIYYSSYGFKGLISRIFLDTEQGPKIIAEHFSLVKD